MIFKFRFNKSGFFLSLLLSLMPLVGNAKIQGIVHKNYTIDVFKSDQISVEEVDKKYGKSFEALAAVFNNVNKMPTEKNPMGVEKYFNIIMQGLAESGSFSYLGLSPIIYGNGIPIGFSIDVVDKSDIKRTQGFLPKQTVTVPDPNNLIKSWLEYERLGMDEFFRAKGAKPIFECGAFHCVFGFDDVKTKPYGLKFNTEVPKYKKELINILKNDKDDLKRGAAAFLLAHLKDGNEIIDILVPSIRDASSHVRNNAMRAIAQTVSKVKHPKVPLDEIIRALSFPSTVDRNKALYVLDSLPKEPRFAEYLIEHACGQIMSQYRLPQRNLHGEAYNVLKNISHKNYALDDYEAWETWAKKNCRATG